MPLAPRTLGRALAVAALAIGALAGCGSTSAGSAGTAASSNPAPPGSESGTSPTGSPAISPVVSDSASVIGPDSTATATASGGVGDASKAAGAELTGAAVCATLPAQTAKQLTGLDITQAVPLAASPDSGDGCGYSSADSSVQVQVQVLSSDSATDSWDVLLQGSKNTTMVSGLGDKAFYDNDGTLYALEDSRLLQVNGVDTQDQAVALATAVLPLL